MRPGIAGPLPRFTREFVSANQVITSGGALVLAHGLGVVPRLVALELVCQVADQGYAIGQVLVCNPGTNGNSNTGVAVVVDATNLSIRYGSEATAFRVLHFASGGVTTLTNTSWRARFRAWA